MTSKNAEAMAGYYAWRDVVFGYSEVPASYVEWYVSPHCQNNNEHEAMTTLDGDSKKSGHAYLTTLVVPSGRQADCVCCGDSGQSGRYEGLPCCFPCYDTGLLLEWLDSHDARDWRGPQE